jgi:nitroimidazol reductase NimA-like FMN-containing flavoprotein (pyridoxamine 5'-phosphate oxidase superfamily)
MALDQQTEMTPAEIDEVLARHETGVLSLARGDEPYAIPISYGYDPENRRFYMRLVSTPESQKREFLSSSPSVRLVVYEEDDQTYRSVIAEGALDRVTTDEMTTERIVQYGQAKRPLFEIWGESKRDLDIQLYELDADALSGRRIELATDDA